MARKVETQVRVGAVAGVILAGGKGSRLFADRPGEKPLVPLGGKPMIAHVVERLQPQVLELAIATTAQGAPAAKLSKLVGSGVEILHDTAAEMDGDSVGPLGGLLAGLEWARRAAPYCMLLATVPADVPFIPLDLVPRLAGHMHVVETDVLVLRAGAQRHNAIALWSTKLAPKLRLAIERDGMRKVDDFIASLRVAELIWPRRMTRPDPFHNVNTPEDLQRAQLRLRGRS
ncbi:MAG: NTP transferase domain-containing protein [Rhodospirillales bacterium]